MGFEIDFLPVGKSKKSGDCTLFRYGDLFAGHEKQTVVVVDGGYAENANEIKNHLTKYYNCTDSDGNIIIDLVILSHTDEDHVNGLVELAKCENVIIKNLLMKKPWESLNPNDFKDGRITNKSLRERLKDTFDKAFELYTNCNGRKIKCAISSFNFNRANFTILGPTEDFYKQCIANSSKTPEQSEQITNMRETNGFFDDSEELYIPGKIAWNDEETTSPINESSLIILFEYESTKILFTGDAGKEALNSAITTAKSKNFNLDNIKIIKMPHHGSRKNLSPELIDKLKSTNTWCIVPCVSGDEGHHPSKRLVNLLIEKGLSVYYTAGKTLHWGYNEPKRNWTSVQSHSTYTKIEKL